ncbi:DNA-directed DNA polymerase [Tanacetum coccineum]
MIYPISDSPWVSPVHCVPKKGGITVVANEENELISTRLVTGWRVCIDYRKLNEATRKDHFPLPFMDQMIERLAGNEFYCFLDGFSGYFQIPIDPQDQEKTTFTCPYGTFASATLCKEGIVLGHKISKAGIEVDRAKVDVIAKLPHPTTVKGVRSFLGQCQLTEAPILVVPDWNLPFELMCDATDFAIGAVLGQQKMKHFQPIHYASKTITEAQIHYTTTEKEIAYRIDSSFCTYKILMEYEFKPSVQPQRRVNPNIKEVVKKEVIKVLDVGLIYPISDSPWVSPIQVVLKKGGMIVVKNEKDELIPQQTVTRWRVCIDYRRLNNATRKDHFPLPFIDQMLERLADGFSGYFQISITPEDQEKTTFTALTGPSHTNECPLDYAMPQPLFNAA